ncbi:MAG TPA: hypothetical protein PKD85_04125 [Saprospiraceae bacterium]|nr:hypothetical protein [Saprospiraceae bacterium]
MSHNNTTQKSGNHVISQHSKKEITEKMELNKPVLKNNEQLIHTIEPSSESKVEELKATSFKKANDSIEVAQNKISNNKSEGFTPSRLSNFILDKKKNKWVCTMHIRGISKTLDIGKLNSSHKTMFIKEIMSNNITDELRTALVKAWDNTHPYDRL